MEGNTTVDTTGVLEEAEVTTLMSLAQVKVGPNVRACNLYNLFVRVIFGGIVVLLGLAGNSLTIVIMGGERKKSSTVRLLFYLAMVDFLVLIEYGTQAVPVAVLRLVGKGAEALKLQMYILAYLVPLSQATNLVSVLVTVSVTWQRYLSVCIPHKAKKYGTTLAVNTQIISAIVFSALFHIPQFFQYRVVENYPSPGRTATVTTAFASTKSYQIFYAIVLFYLFSYILPIIALGYMTYALIKALAESRAKHQEMTSQSQRAKEELTLSLVVVVIIFIICQSIGPARRILMWIYVPYRSALQCGGALFYLGPWIIVSVLINSAVNFVIYVLIAKGFRKKLRNIFRRKVKVAPLASGETPNTKQTYQLDSIPNTA